MKRLTDNQPGFTIVELMMATAVFSVILLVGLTGFVQIGRAYYKGLTISQTNDTAQQILNDVSAQIRLSSSVSAVTQYSGNIYYQCIGNHRYTFNLFNLVDPSNHDNISKFGLLEDELPGNSGCGNPYSMQAPLSNPAELLGNQMRLLNFSITPVGSSGLYSVQVTVASGQDSALTDPTSPTAQCKLQLGGTQFCAVTTLSTIVYEGE